MPDQIRHGRQWIDPHIACNGYNSMWSIISVMQYDYKIATMLNPKNTANQKYNIITATIITFQSY